MRLIFLLFCLSHALSGFTQSPIQSVQSVLDSVLVRAEATSLYTADVDWKQLTTECYDLALEAKSISELAPAFEHMINALRDHHGRILSAMDYSNLAFFTDQEHIRFKDTRERDSSHWALMNDTTARFEYALLPGKIGYLKVVGIGPTVQQQAEASRIRAAINELAQAGVQEWILDLRFNTGGNGNVMLSGLAPLLDASIVVQLHGANNSIQCEAEIKRGNYTYCGTQAFQMPNRPKLKKQKIAILMSSWTASSGELTAVAFKGQSNTRFFGESSGGYTTNTGGEYIGEEIILVISTGVFGDRNGVAYNETVPVDQYIPLVFEVDPAKDPAIIAAKAWLK